MLFWGLIIKTLLVHTFNTMLNILLYSCAHDLQNLKSYNNSDDFMKQFYDTFTCLYKKHFHISYEDITLPSIFNIVSKNIRFSLKKKHKIPNILHYIWITNFNIPSTYPMCAEIELVLSTLNYSKANIWSNLNNKQNQYLCNDSSFVNIKKVYNLSSYEAYIKRPMKVFLSSKDSNYYIILVEILRAAILIEYGGIIINGSYNFFNNPYILNKACDFIVGRGITFNGGYVAAKPHHNIVQGSLYLMYENLISYNIYNGFFDKNFTNNRLAIELFFQGSLEISYFLYGNRDNIDCIFPESFFRSFSMPYNTDGYNVQINHSSMVIKKITWVNIGKIGHWNGFGQFHFSDISASITKILNQNISTTETIIRNDKTLMNSYNTLENKCYKSDITFLYYTESTLFHDIHDQQYSYLDLKEIKSCIACDDQNSYSIMENATLVTDLGSIIAHTSHDNKISCNYVQDICF